MLKAYNEIRKGGSMFYCWLWIVILLSVIEVLTINLTTIWFVASGLVSLILSFFIEDVTIQIAVFTLLGVFLLLVTRPFLKKYMNKPTIATNLDRIIGMEGIVTEKITKTTGEVKVDGKRWTAYAEKVINKDTMVKVLKINGVKIKVEKVEE